MVALDYVASTEDIKPFCIRSFSGSAFSMAPSNHGVKNTMAGKHGNRNRCLSASHHAKPSHKILGFAMAGITETTLVK
jgi:hypothetical protein